MPKFGQLVDTDVWDVTARTLTDISAEEIFDLPAFDDLYTRTAITSSATQDTYGSWGQISADIGAGKRIIAVLWRNRAGVGANQVEIEIGEGASGSEAAVCRVVFSPASGDLGNAYVWKALTDNARISARIKTAAAEAFETDVHLLVA